MNTYTPPAVTAELVAALNSGDITGQGLDALLMIIGENFPMLQEKLGKLHQSIHENRLKLNQSIEQSYLENHGAKSIAALAAATPAQYAELLATLPVKAVAPLDVEETRAFLRNVLFIETIDHKLRPVDGLQHRGSLAKFQESRQAESNRPTAEDSGIFALTDNVDGGDAIVLWFQNGTAADAPLHMLLVGTALQQGPDGNQQLAFEHQVFHVLEGRWVVDGSLAYLTDTLRMAATGGNRSLGLNYSRLNADLGVALAEIDDAVIDAATGFNAALDFKTTVEGYSVELHTARGSITMSCGGKILADYPLATRVMLTVGLAEALKNRASVGVTEVEVTEEAPVVADTAE